MMNLDFSTLNGADTYKVLSSLVVPRPIALVTTIDAQGCTNAAPFSFFNVMGTRPPMVVFAPGDRAPGVPKDTARNLEVNGRFIVHIVDEKMTPAMARCAADLPLGESELTLAGLSGVVIGEKWPMRIEEAPVALACTTHSIQMIGRNRMVVGLVEQAWIRDGILEEDSLRLNAESWSPVGRMEGPDAYLRGSDKFHHPNG